MIPHKDDRPRCSVDGCESPKAITGLHKDGSPKYRKICEAHHQKVTASRYGFNTISQITAMRNGFDDVTEYRNSYHPYRQHRKNYCENVDGRLGFVCTTTIAWDGMLDVDHKNGNHLDNRKRNLQTLCKCCHAYKTNKKKDYLSPGRKTRQMITT
jgi:5-methylcytosine-specific restriction endonuclease McrA